MRPDDFLTAPDRRPPGGSIVWARAADGVNLRLGLWPAEGAKGTVLIFQGRAEFVEKYGPLAIELAARGYACAGIDWRGQGYSQRLTRDPLLGHVGDIADYQQDVAVLTAEAAKAGLPRPWFVLAHSTGGMIALRALTGGLDAAAVAFSAPLWDIKLTRRERIFATLVTPVCDLLGLSRRKAPRTDYEPYTLTEPFETNMLTSDRGLWDFMVATQTAHPAITLGAPTCGWVHEVLKEAKALRSRPLPALPCLIAHGSEEAVVDPRAIRRIAARWPGATVQVLAGARHEVVIETAPLRGAFLDACTALFDAQL